MKNQAKSDSDVEPTDGVITLWIDSYSDIFSDFDPRSISERAVSDDFVTQVKRVSRETNNKIKILKLLIPEGTQKEEYERVIKKRLQSYFQNLASQLNLNRKQLRQKGGLFTTFGILLMIIATYISFLQLSGFTYKLLLALFEPGGWFLLWTGLDYLLSNSWDKNGDRSFYHKFANIHVEFRAYK